MDYAFENRIRMMVRVEDIVAANIIKYLGQEVTFGEEINCRHNYAALEHHYDKNVWVHRKGGTRAREGELAVIPGRYCHSVAYDKSEEKPRHLEIEMNSRLNKLCDWYAELNFHNVYYEEGRTTELLDKSLKDYKVYYKDGTINTLLTFNLQLNQIIILINNPMLFPHQAYAAMFNGNKIDQEDKHE